MCLIPQVAAATFSLPNDTVLLQGNTEVLGGGLIVLSNELDSNYVGGTMALLRRH